MVPIQKILTHAVILMHYFSFLANFVDSSLRLCTPCTKNSVVRCIYHCSQSEVLSWAVRNSQCRRTCSLKYVVLVSSQKLSTLTKGNRRRSARKQLDGSEASVLISPSSHSYTDQILFCIKEILARRQGKVFFLAVRKVTRFRSERSLHEDRVLLCHINEI